MESYSIEERVFYRPKGPQSHHHNDNLNDNGMITATAVAAWVSLLWVCVLLQEDSRLRMLLLFPLSAFCVLLVVI